MKNCTCYSNVKKQKQNQKQKQNDQNLNPEVGVHFLKQI
jgi:hypothetical protein